MQEISVAHGLDALDLAVIWPVNWQTTRAPVHDEHPTSSWPRRKRGTRGPGSALEMAHVPKISPAMARHADPIEAVEMQLRTGC